MKTVSQFKLLYEFWSFVSHRTSRGIVLMIEKIHVGRSPVHKNDTVPIRTNCNIICPNRNDVTSPADMMPASVSAFWRVSISNSILL